jgi:hypothetical protein
MEDSMKDELNYDEDEVLDLGAVSERTEGPNGSHSETQQPSL